MFDPQQYKTSKNIKKKIILRITELMRVIF